MKKSDRDINAIFSVAGEMVPDNGEDSYYYEAKDGRFIISSFDGLGGSGAKKYENYSGKTGAYVASRAVCGSVKVWFEGRQKGEELIKYIRESLDILNSFADSKTSKLKGSLSKSFPTTAAILTGELKNNNLDIDCYWAGDSRCYMLDSEGLYQLTNDDLDGQDAMSNLSEDGVMTNVINAGNPFSIHSKKIVREKPCILLTATDGCFGYLNSPMEFEYLLVDSLVNSKNISEWKESLDERMREVTGDDYTLCVAIYGFKNFDDIKKNLVKRHIHIKTKYIDSDADVFSLWEDYKKDYSRYL